MTETNLISVSHAVYQCTYHVQWCTKYRYETLRREKYKNEMDAIIRQVAERHRIKIVELSVMPEHIHGVINAPMSMSPSRVQQLLKGASSHEFFARHPIFRKRYPQGHFWGAGKFCRTVGDVDLETTRNYVREQTTLHQWV